MECPICLTEFEKEEEKFFLPCTHSFHQICIIGWLKSQEDKVCPICQQAISSPPTSYIQRSKKYRPRYHSHCGIRWSANGGKDHCVFCKYHMNHAPIVSNVETPVKSGRRRAKTIDLSTYKSVGTQTPPPKHPRRVPPPLPLRNHFYLPPE